mmetsp:Transcript_10814/g.33148  ORF Transcript_10814/g.33148 Transcript_10814/m.33148 type:complete len:179 (+) Transcript_10814:1849-2385(+)
MAAQGDSFRVQLPSRALGLHLSNQTLLSAKICDKFGQYRPESEHSGIIDATKKVELIRKVPGIKRLYTMTRETCTVTQHISSALCKQPPSFICRRRSNPGVSDTEGRFASMEKHRVYTYTPQSHISMNLHIQREHATIAHSNSRKSSPWRYFGRTADNLLYGDISAKQLASSNTATFC